VWSSTSICAILGSWLGCPKTYASAPLRDADFVGANGFLSAAVFANVISNLQILDADLHTNNGAVLSSLY
jgi:hypothetical protein